MKSLRAFTGAVFLAVTLAACSKHSVPTAGVPIGHLFVANFATGGAASTVTVYALPLTAASIPTATISAANGAMNASGVATDATHLYLVNGPTTNTVTVYALPITSTSTASVAFAVGAGVNAVSPALDKNGNLFVGQTVGTPVPPVAPRDGFRQFVPPFTATTTASISNTVDSGFINQIVLDSAGNLYGGKSTNLAFTSTGGIVAYTGPVSAGAAPAFTINSAQSYGGLAMDASGRLYAANLSTASIEVYASPILSTSTPLFSFVTTGSPTGLALDSRGNLYVSDSTAGITEYNAPLSATSTANITIPNGSAGINGATNVAVGP